MTLKVTSLEELRKVKKQLEGQVIDLPPFIPGTEFHARVRRLWPIDLVKVGKIPNELLISVSELMSERDKQIKDNGTVTIADDDKRIKDFDTLITAICEAALIEPTVEELANIGLKLTEEQKITIYNYTQKGVEALNSFREEQGNCEDSQCSQNV